MTAEMPTLPLPPELRHICLEDEIVAYAHDVARAYAEQQNADLLAAALAAEQQTAELRAEVDRLMALLIGARDALYNGFEPNNQSKAWHKVNNGILQGMIDRAARQFRETKSSRPEQS